MNITFPSLNTSYRPSVSVQPKTTPRKEKASGDYDTVNIRRSKALDDETFARMLAKKNCRSAWHCQQRAGCGSSQEDGGWDLQAGSPADRRPDAGTGLTPSISQPCHMDRKEFPYIYGTKRTEVF